MSSRSDVFYLTTPIYYINGPPHLGHAYSTLVADTLCRYRRLRGDDVFFLTGTDEHGDKIAQAAARAGEPPRALADRNSAAFRAQWDLLGITNDDFIRTTEPRHARVVQGLLSTLWDKGEIYFGKYGGDYCYGCERFYTEKEIADGKCPDHQTPLTRIEEENYFFRMSRYQDWLRDELLAHPERVQPDRYRNELLGFLRDPLEDLCISRPRTRLEWGIPLPFDDRFVTYVWFDALINYVSAPGGPGAERFERYWPHVQHLIGKDILKPHGIYWPCMLKAAGLPVYTRLNVGGYWNLGGGKMSKSLGNVVAALQLADTYGRDALRYFVLREMPFGQDASFSEEALVERLNAELANDLGNLVARATTMIGRFGQGRPGPAGGGDAAVLDAIPPALAQVEAAMLEFAVHRALAEIWGFVRLVNGYIDQTQPWALARTEADRARLDQVLATLLQALRFLGVVLEPFVPDAARRIRAGTGLPEAPGRLADQAWARPPADLLVEKVGGLFPRVERDEPGPKTEGAPGPAVKAGGAAAPSPRRDSPAAPAPSAPAPPPDRPAPSGGKITLDEFKRVELRVAEIVAAEPVPRSKKLLKLTVRVGEETRTLVAGIAEHYPPATLPGRKVVVVANLEPATLMGVTSNGMVLAGSAGDSLALLTPDRDLPPGAVVR